MNDTFLYRHYVTVDERNRVTDGWSNGEHPGIGKGQNDRLITDHGSIEFRLTPDGEAHPDLKTEDDIPLYKWDEDNGVVPRTEEEIEADRAALHPVDPEEPTDEEKREAQLYYTAMMTDTLLDF